MATFVNIFHDDEKEKELKYQEKLKAAEKEKERLQKIADREHMLNQLGLKTD